MCAVPVSLPFAFNSCVYSSKVHAYLRAITYARLNVALEDNTCCNTRYLTTLKGWIGLLSALLGGLLTNLLF